MSKFHYVYNAPTEEERKEIASIRRQYASNATEEGDKLERLRLLHARVYNAANCVSWVLGILSCLLFGLGMTMVLEWSLILVGVLVAAVGGVGMGLAYPVYKIALGKGKKKHGEEILKLSEELLHEE